MNFSSGKDASRRKMHLFNICLVLLIFIWIDLSIIQLNPSFFSAATIQRNDQNDLLLTLQEKETLKSFKEKVQNRLTEDHMKTDFYLVRWLRVKEYDVAEAERMLMLNVKWRQDNNISQILSEDFSDIRENYHSTTDTHDKNDRPICTVNLGTWDIRAAVVQGKLPRLTRYVDQFLETLFQNILTAQQSGMEVTRALFLIDLEGFNLYQHTCPSCISIFVKLVLGLESHYPRCMEEIIIINSPPMFRLVLDGIGGVMTKDVRKTIKLIGNNKNQWMDYLDARVDRSQRYANFGGNKIA